MREIKFRHYFPSTKVITAGHDVMTLILTATGKEDFWKDAVWMQYTGLKDKNGKEIYEGDIMTHPIEKRWFPWVIEFHGASFCLVNIGIDGYKHEPMYLTEDRVSEREIVGNIYENPELLTDDKARVSS